MPAVGSEPLERAQLGKAATTAATIRLRERYADEYEAMVVEERLARGLPAIRDSTLSIVQLRARVEELEAELANRDA
jgi:Zn-dependent protease with chaperone function